MITVIGGGPAGSYAAYLLAKSGKKVEVIERGDIGKPIQCAGIISERLTDFFDEKEIKKFLVNKVNKAKIVSPNGKSAEINLKDNFIVNREKFDKYLAEKARKAGAKYYLKNEFLGVKKKNGNLTLKVRNKNKIIKKTTKILVGADGPLSAVAKNSGLFKKRKFFVGVQARAKIKNDNIVEFFLFKQGIAWAIPENKNTVRLGIATQHNTNYFFRKFLEKKLGAGFNKKIIEYNGGIIPIHNPGIITQKNNIFLLGDAATMTKATTLGGIIQSLAASQSLADSIINEKNYDAEWRKKIGGGLLVSYLMRRMMNKFSEEDFNKLIKILSKKKNQKLMKSFDRDAPTKFILKLAIKEPGMLRFVKFLI